MSSFFPLPLSSAAPTRADLELTARLREVLQAANFFESEEEGAKREIVLGKLDSIVKEWIRKVSLKKNFSEALAAEAGGKIFTLGSYRLGVHQKGADIDTLVLGPKHIDRDDFFNDLHQMLLERPEVSKLTPVPDAHTPIMKMVFSGIEIDLLHATLQRSSIPDDINLSDISILQNLDEKSVRSLNGPRVADELLRLVPDIQVYRLALCAIKLWAQRRGVYSNIMGYLGGIAWALMTARICQFYPKACAATIVTRFFKVYKDWKWPNPVLLKPLEDGPLGFRVWNPTVNATDKLHRMPIITPAYPCMNSTYNVSRSTFETMHDEFVRGAEITERIELGKAAWEELFEKSDFFTRYKFYLEMLVSAGAEDELASWRGFVESRVRQLIMALERNPMIERASPYADSFAHAPQPVEAKEGEPEPAAGAMRHSVSFFVGLVIQKPMQPDLLSPHRAVDLSFAVDEFLATLDDGRTRRTPTMAIEIRHTKQSQLPPYALAEAGGKKRVRTAGSPGKAGGRKRKAGEDADGTPTPDPTASPALTPAKSDDAPPSQRPRVDTTPTASSGTDSAVMLTPVPTLSSSAAQTAAGPPVPTAVQSEGCVPRRADAAEHAAAPPCRTHSQHAMLELDGDLGMAPAEPSGPAAKKQDIKINLMST